MFGEIQDNRKKIKIGVFGIVIAHTSSLKDSDRASVVAICESVKKLLNRLNYV